MDFRSVRDTVVVLDATELHRDWFLVGLESQLLRFLIDEAGLRVVVPMSVLVEVAANHAREYSRAKSQFLKHSDALRRVVGRSSMPAIELPAATDYREQLLIRLENMGVELLPWPEASHEDVVMRAANRQPPFNDQGSGYRDALVWLSCLDLIGAGETVVLVSQDNDFADGRSGLAAALVREARELPGSVELVRNLGSWLLSLVPWREVGDLKEAVAFARDEAVAAMFVPWDIFDDPQFTADELGLPTNAKLEEVAYYGSGDMILERLSHAQAADRSTRVVYRFYIEFDVTMTLPGEEAHALGYIEELTSFNAVETVHTIVPLIGEMVVVHDESAADGPLYYDAFHFRPTTSQPR